MSRSVNDRRLFSVGKNSTLRKDWQSLNQITKKFTAGRMPFDATAWCNGKEYSVSRLVAGLEDIEEISNGCGTANYPD